MKRWRAKGGPGDHIAKLPESRPRPKPLVSPEDFGPPKPPETLDTVLKRIRDASEEATKKFDKIEIEMIEEGRGVMHMPDGSKVEIHNVKIQIPNETSPEPRFSDEVKKQIAAKAKRSFMDILREARPIEMPIKVSTEDRDNLMRMWERLHSLDGMWRRNMDDKMDESLRRHEADLDRERRMRDEYRPPRPFHARHRTGEGLMEVWYRDEMILKGIGHFESSMRDGMVDGWDAEIHKNIEVLPTDVALYELINKADAVEVVVRAGNLDFVGPCYIRRIMAGFGWRNDLRCVELAGTGPMEQVEGADDGG